MSSLYSFEYLLFGNLRKFSVTMNGEDTIEEPVQDQSFSCTAAQKAAIAGHIEATRRLARAFGPENIDTIEVVRAGSGYDHIEK